jgi:hypothetical protein
VGILRTLAQNHRWWVRAAVAEHPQTPAGVLLLLAQDKHTTVRGSVASRLHIPMQALLLLAQNQDASTRYGGPDILPPKIPTKGAR